MFPGPRKKSFSRSANAILGKFGRAASEEITVELVHTYINIWLGMFHVTEKGLKIVGLRCYAISHETVQIVRHGCNSRMSAIFWF